MKVARTNLSYHKAIGLDQLADMLYKDDKFWEKVKGRLLQTFNVWCCQAQIPSYINRSRIVSLSKEDGTQYPSFSNIRTISILPCTMKILELALLQKLKHEITRLKLIHPNQIGFEETHQCTEHIQTIIQVVKD